ncbi:hypothetical protein ACFQ1E_11740 [Sphingomonas canadensis]|uniref:DUF3618 domain-containing protein n=1 Tax=Sphingomonas canadensis TaxID=1219257 RepID=A0ABW3H6B8_9SPHN|nr:hypothetical protein [Sphingomonas canadensis]MCW3836854.1 hypothetical protein [Sphingomonas canadensis]
MTNPAEARAQARERSEAARTRLMATLGEVQERFRPANLAQDAVEGAAQGFASAARRGASAVRARPWWIAAFSGAIGLAMARGWIADIVRGKGDGDATPAPADGLDSKTKRAPRARKGRSR